MTRRARKIVTPLLAVLGVQAWLLILNNWGFNSHLILLAVALFVGVIGPIHRIIWWFLRRLRRPPAGMHVVTAMVVAVVAGAALARSAIASGRDLFPTMHDEFQFLVQARMLASGKLWMPGHPLVDFFDTFYVLVQPKYAAQSFPGTAFFYVPVIWLHLAPWKWAVGLAGVCVGMFYLVVTEMIDGLAGLLGAVMLSCLSMFRYVSTMVLAQTSMLLLGLGAVWIYLRWRKSGRHRIAWAGGLGFVCGMMAVTRPADGVIFCAPIGVGMLVDLWKKRPRDCYPWALGQAVVLVLAAAPWIGLQLVFDRGVTGEWLTTPFAIYNQRDQPALAYGIRAPEVDRRPVTRVVEKQEYYRKVVEPAVAAQRPDLLWHTFLNERLPVTMGDGLPQPMLLVLLPVGLLAWGRRRAWVLGATLPLFFLMYMFYPLFPAHYTIVVAPAAILTVLLAAKAVRLAWPGARAGAWSGMAAFVVGLLFVRQVDCFELTSATAFHAEVLRAADEQTAKLAGLGKPVVVLFRRDPKLKLDHEPVYNLDAAWPDDELVIRAHDRGSENDLIFKYYAEHGADRGFYLFDESRVADGVRFLGMGSDLARRSDGQSSGSP